MPADKETVEKIAKCLELMASDHDGEALAAARKATLLLKRADLQWRQVLGFFGPTPAAPTVHRPGPPPAAPGNQWGGGLGGLGGAPGFGAGHPFGGQQYNPYAGMNAQQQAYRDHMAHAQQNAYRPPHTESPSPEVETGDRAETKSRWFRRNS